MRQSVLISALIAASAGTAAAQDIVLPGNSHFKPQCIAPTDTLELTAVIIGRPNRVTNTIVQTRSAATEGERAVCVIARRFLGPDSFNVDTTVYDATTMAPVRFVVVTRGSHNDFRLRGDTVNSRVQQPDSTIAASSAVLPRPVFLGPADFAVAEALPLVTGLTLDFDVWTPPRSMPRVRAHVDGVDTLTVRGRPVAAWRITWTDGTARSTYWISQEQPRLVRTRTIVPNAELWRLIKGDKPHIQ